MRQQPPTQIVRNTERSASEHRRDDRNDKGPFIHVSPVYGTPSYVTPAPHTTEFDARFGSEDACPSLLGPAAVARDGGSPEGLSKWSTRKEGATVEPIGSLKPGGRAHEG
jgi:hypothetical protein